MDQSCSTVLHHAASEILSDMRGLEWRLAVVEDREKPCAKPWVFSLPGGFLVVHTSMLKAIYNASVPGNSPSRRPGDAHAMLIAVEVRG